MMRTKSFLAAATAILLIMPTAAFGITVSGGNSRTLVWPEGADPDAAILTYHASYPLVNGNDEISEAINASFAYLLDDAEAFTVPIIGEMLNEGERHTIRITSTVTCNNLDFFSVLSVTENNLNGESSTIYSGYTFALTGSKAGIAVSLPRVLGILTDTGNDLWLEERQTEKANQAVRSLVWEALQLQDGLYDWMDQDTLSSIFFPEQDFYLDENGDPVFFLIAGLAADESVGTLLFPISLEDLMDEL